MNDDEDSPVAADPAGGKAGKSETLAERVEKAESGGPKGPEPTRYGDWEKKGRCIDF